MRLSSVVFGLLLAAAAPLIAEQKLNLPLPESGVRYTSAEETKPQWPAEPGEGTVCLWGDGKMGAISITIDDNNYPDVEFWQRMSEKFGWKFTWFLIVYPGMYDIYNQQPGNNLGYNGTPEKWKVLYDQGHEIELHGSCKQMNHLSQEDYREHIALSQKYLEDNIGNRILSYAYPCGASGTKDEPGIYQEVIGETMIAARGTQGGSTPPHLIDYLNTRSLGAVGFHKPEVTQKRFDQMLDPKRPWKYSYYRGWGIVLYHGLLKDEKKATAEAGLQFIKDREDHLWIAPFTVVARYAQERETAKLDIASASVNEIRFNVSDDMDDSIYNIPLTVKFRVDGWSGAVAQQNGEPAKAWVIEHEGAQYAMVYAIPDAGEVVLRKQ
ncbi:polysaccharide deacetylase family protein [Cerasicoccus maritimus]|uniref:polysaccharide deacetylase family protein n=1 Tax=Cerasicoccus maritimus TaxID=490089 RepID=UPI002852B403|nr:polysaccharide deacetylase family protein [Cerasicoccus maritimus]